jgi:hypothetical protein
MKRILSARYVLCAIVWAVIHTGACSSGGNGDARRGGESGNQGGFAGETAIAGQAGATNRGEGGHAGSVGPVVEAERPRDAMAMMIKDAGVVDASNPSGTCPGVLCENFESGQLTSPAWSVYKDPMTNTVEVVQALPGGAKPAHGRYALHLKGRNGQAAMRSIRVPPILQRHQFGRFYYYLVSKTPDHHTAIQWSSVAKGWPYSDTHYEINLQGTSTGLAWWDVGNQFGGGEGGPAPGTSAFASNRWYCVEWEYDDTNGKQTLWIDGVQKSSGVNRIPNKVAWPLPQIGIGWRIYVAQPYDLDAYVDDVALGEARVGCLP